MIPIASSAFLGVDYNSETRTLTVYLEMEEIMFIMECPNQCTNNFLTLLQRAGITIST